MISILINKILIYKTYTQVIVWLDDNIVDNKSVDNTLNDLFGVVVNISNVMLTDVIIRFGQFTGTPFGTFVDIFGYGRLGIETTEDTFEKATVCGQCQTKKDN